MSREFLWWTRSKTSKNGRLPCSPNAISRTALLFALKFCTQFHKTLLCKRVSKFLVIVCSFFFKGISWSKITHFYEKHIKIISKPIKHNKNADTPLLLLLFTTGSTWKKILEKHYSWVQALKKVGKQLVLGALYRNIYQILKVNFQ